MDTQTQTTSRLKTSLEHLKRHVEYPADRNTLVQACNNMQDSTPEDKAWFTDNIPTGTFKGPTDVLNALLAKV